MFGEYYLEKAARRLMNTPQSRFPSDSPSISNRTHKSVSRKHELRELCPHFSTLRSANPKFVI